ncbi:ribosome small subunit-dependent GTPase A [Jingyaoa shaoxingensis]|uniref:Small ribosomal subunit biogenesis GTPase RsgA n=1 Tax=Jingyaoa shaoxingensis TaxID=2763671 RepID=A0ABR7N5N3_9FIRM|nr:ribosome small subunit-dependent GTPase A [Jingyaoa shaoxingensis]MBC8571712.1 ribosome small subunit-dependent GTPase A [Jingyaoa shaoxingensis]
MRGKIIKGIAGFYYVQTTEGLYECKAKGIFRKEKIKPLVGDDVEISVTDKDKKTGNVDQILPRKNTLIRPAVSNIDQVLVIFAAASPKPNLNLLDRFLVSMEKQGVPAVICFNKQDMVEEEEQHRLRHIYENSGCRVLFTCAEKNQGIRQVRELLNGKTTAVAGPSGVGKSTMVNLLAPEAQMETGEISKKIDRGKHTTRHSEILLVGERTYICDTPGFTSLAVWDMEKEELKDYFREFGEYEGQCRFQGCTHTHEPGCRVKEALDEGKISRQRYDNYLEMYTELKEKRRY